MGGNPASLTALVGGFAFALMIFGWFGRVTKIRRDRKWMDGTVTPVSREERRRQNAGTLAYLALVLAIGAAIATLAAIMWPHPHA